MTDERGQAYTLEGVIGAILVATALILGLQAVSIEPWAGPGADQGVDTRVQAEDTLDIAQDKGALEVAVTCLGGSTLTTPHSGVLSTDPPTQPVGVILANTIDGVANYNVYIDYPGSSGEIQTLPSGSPDTPVQASVTVTRQVVLFDDDPVYQFNEDRRECVPSDDYDTLAEADDDGALYLDNQDDDSDIFAVVQVRVVAW